MIRTALPLFGLLLAACVEASSIPTENVVDYAVTFTAASASSSCHQDVQAEADTFESYSQIYRVHFIDGPDEPRVDVYWRAEGSNDGDFSWFAAGVLENDLESGALSYASTRLSEQRQGGTVWYDLDGRAPVRFTDEIRNAREDFIIVEPTAVDGYSVGCVFSLEFDGTRLNPTAEGA